MNARVNSQALIAGLAGLIGIWLLVLWVPDSIIFFIVQFIELESLEPWSIWVILVRPAIFVVLGIGMLAGRWKLAKKLAPSSSEQEVSGLPLLSAGITLMGVYLLAQGLVAISEALAVQVQESYVSVQTYARGTASIVFGIVLFLFSGGITGVWAMIRRLRYAGL